jgi:hypothetical protein
MFQLNRRVRESQARLMRVEIFPEEMRDLVSETSMPLNFYKMRKIFMGRLT